jgi:hypothetical protein
MSDINLESLSPISFEEFWRVWPNKVAKKAALRAWAKVPIKAHRQIVYAIGRAKNSDQWRRGVIPHPATWLNGNRWEDYEYVEPKPVVSVAVPEEPGAPMPDHLKEMVEKMRREKGIRR